ncbi:EamA family transporter RarD [Lentibacillus sediminis]|uniref:EamA family transporter RarD n=1 Tax=Lentibacillus sediminis TaxID=1940529 RepID=UPI001863D830|nr:EamA family transporter RarD [Lentibacillus sediminis]
MMQQQEKLGMIYAASAYLLWGFLPIYWKLADAAPPGEILAHRIVWSFIFMLIIIIISRKWTSFLGESKALLKNKKRLAGITAASVFISLNWLTFIWAVNSDYVIQASLGYYINPLVSILLGILVLKERTTRRQNVSFILAGIGVVYLTVSFGVFPWVSLVLALSFAFYGLLKKQIDVSAMTGLTIETMIVTPLALIYLFVLPETAFSLADPVSTLNLLLMGAGVATAIPLLLFASGAKKIPLGLVGFLQYIAPTIMLILGVFLYNEPFTSAHLVAFILIWFALFLYMSSAYRRPRSQRKSA